MITGTLGVWTPDSLLTSIQNVFLKLVNFVDIDIIITSNSHIDKDACDFRQQRWCLFWLFQLHGLCGCWNRTLRRLFLGHFSD